MVLGANGALTITDTNGGHTLTLGAGSLDCSPAIHSVTMINTIALSADQTWKWSSNSYTLTIASNLNNGGHPRKRVKKRGILKIAFSHPQGR